MSCSIWRPKTTPVRRRSRQWCAGHHLGGEQGLPRHEVRPVVPFAIGLSWAGFVDVITWPCDWDPATIAASQVPESALLGVEATLWSETLVTMRDVEFLAFPRLAAIAEVGWSAAEARRNWNAFKVRLGGQARRWSALGINAYWSPKIDWQR